MARKDRPDMAAGVQGYDALYPQAPEPASSPQAPPGAEAVPATPPKSKWGAGRSRSTRSFSLTDDLFGRLQAYAHAKGATYSDVVEIALGKALDRAEEANGGPFPPPPRTERKSLDDL